MGRCRMKIITRHLLREYLLHLFYCLAGFCMILVLYDLFDKVGALISARVTLQTAAGYYAGMIATSLEFLAPASLLLATLYTLWQLTRNNEITAMRASGVSLFGIARPFLSVGLAFALLTGAVKEFVTPRVGLWAMTLAQSDFKEVEKHVFNHHAYYSTGTYRLWLLTRYDLNAPTIVDGVKVTEERPDGSRIRDTLATRAEFLDGVWWFHGVQVQEYNEQDMPAGGLQPPEPDRDTAREMSSFTETPGDFALNVKPWDFLSVREMRRYLNANPDLSPIASAQKRFDVHSRIAGPWACVVVIVLGIPAGVRGGRRNALVGILGAISLFFAFYAASQVGIFLGKRNVLWPWVGAWLSNLVFFLTGSVMMWRMR